MKTIWSLLVIYIPKPEIEEITRIIGKKAIDKNEVYSSSSSFYSFYSYLYIYIYLLCLGIMS